MNDYNKTMTVREVQIIEVLVALREIANLADIRPPFEPIGAGRRLERIFQTAKKARTIFVKPRPHE